MRSLSSSATVNSSQRKSSFDLRHLPARFPPPFARAWGDDRFGVWADVVLRSNKARVVQRFRWIKPDSFRMGSPQTEPDRFPNEGPQHKVILAHGFWLGDTACTQEFWSAVMNSHPRSSELGDQLPVKDVSWHEVQALLRKLATLLPDCLASLPTEAQWEYACRAGTETAFSFGASIAQEQANFGAFRGKRLPVKSLPPNNWGLYEMHGNVWEWCADPQRQYSEADAIDPTGGAKDQSSHATRALRGGSWVNDAKRVRSAHRHECGPSDRDELFGFRISLSPSESNSGQPSMVFESSA